MTEQPDAGLTPRTALKLYLLAFATFIVGTNGFVIAGILPDIADELDTTTAGVGLAITVYAGIVAVLAPTFATIFARVSRTALMSVGMLVIAAGAGITVVADTLPLFIAGRAVAAVGGAAIVPTATAAASTVVGPAYRGRAIAIVLLGFTLATAIGLPLGTAVASVGGWHLPLAGVTALSALSAGAIALFVRDVPISPPLSIARRFAVFAEPRILLPLIATCTIVAGFNTAYLFSSTYTVTATGGSGALLAALLLVYGVGGILGNVLAGRLTDRFGNRPVAMVFVAAHLLALLVLPFVEPYFLPLAVVFLFWGTAVFATGIPVQHRLVEIDPPRAAVSISWYSTALYVGITVAPLVGALAIETVGASFLPHAAAVLVLVGGVLLHVAYALGGRRPGGSPRV